MKSAFTSIFAAGMLAAGGAAAQDAAQSEGLGQGFQLSGSVSVGGLKLYEKSNNAYRLKEYRDVDSGIITAFDVKGRGTDYYVNAFGENLGRDDQGVDVRGGKYNAFKYQVFESRLVHNWTFDARSPYSGIGTDTLTATLPNLNPDTWNTFDFRKKRDNVGGMFEFWMGSPWFVRVDANEVTDRGLQLISGANGTSPGQGFTDKPFPVDFKTRNASIEGGYATKHGQFTVSALHSTFSNQNDTFRWTNGFFGNGLDTTWLPPDNEYSKLAVNGTLKQLPWGSTLAGRVTYSKTTTSVPIATSVLNSTAGAFSPTNPDEASFEGDVRHKTASLSLYSNPTRDIDTRVYWNYYKKDNRSPEITFATAAVTGLSCSSANCVTEVLNYMRRNLGADVGYRINSTNRVVAGLDYVDLDRNRVDFDNTKDKTARIEWRNTTYDWLGTRVKYQHMQRRSHFLEGNAGTGPVDPAFLDRFIARFDASNVDQDLLKIGMDITPAELWDVGFEAIVKHNKYKDTVLGRTKDDRQELYFSVARGDPSQFRWMAFADLELVKYDAFHRNISNPPPAVGVPTAAQSTAFDPNSAPTCASATTCNYNWDATNRDRSWAVGLGADWLPTSRLKMNGSIIAQWTHGTADFSVQQTPIQISPTADRIYNFDNMRKITLNLKGTYTLTRRWDVTGGYAYERFKFSDIAIDDYSYTVSSGTGASYLSGAYAKPNFNASIVYLVGTYKF
jgi:MtrB/PioB family decaheme-associated outer membrane protein